MSARHVGTLSALMVSLFTSVFGMAQVPQPGPTPLYTGSIGGGFAITGGNTDTKNFNVTAGMIRDPKTRNVIRVTAAYLRGDQNDLLKLAPLPLGVHRSPSAPIWIEASLTCGMSTQYRAGRLRSVNWTT